MKEFLYKTLNELKLEYTPHTEALLEIYTSAIDEDLVLTQKYLKSELIRLLQTSNLADLIIYEYMKSSDYDGRTEVSLEDVQLNYIPHTKHLLRLYLINQHEGTIECTYENLREVLLELHKDDSLGSLFAGEWIYSTGGLEPRTLFPLTIQKEIPGNLKELLIEELQILNNFAKLKEYRYFSAYDEILKSHKKSKYLGLDEEGIVVFSQEQLTPTSLPLEKNLKETTWKLNDKIHDLEDKIGELILEYLKHQGINLPPNFRFTLDMR